MFSIIVAIGKNLEIGQNNKLLCHLPDDLKYFKNKSFDVIFTDAVLIYIGKDKIRKIISEMQRIAKKAIILVEFHYEQENILGFYEKGFWVRNYRKLFQLLNLKTRIVKIPPNAWGGNWEERGFIIEVKL